MNSGVWTNIQVPSCWEQEGFGQYNYGHVPFEERLKEEGHYRHTFSVDKAWKGQVIELVFEGMAHRPERSTREPFSILPMIFPNL